MYLENFKGFDIKSGYKGCIDGKYQEFDTEDEYIQLVREEQEENEKEEKKHDRPAIQ